MRYPFCLDITDNFIDDLVLFTQFECEVEIEVELDNGELTTTCTDVFVDGISLRQGSAISKAIRLQVMELADNELAAGGDLWDQVSMREDVSFVGHGSPDARWVMAAE